MNKELLDVITEELGEGYKETVNEMSDEEISELFKELDTEEAKKIRELSGIPLNTNKEYVDSIKQSIDEYKDKKVNATMRVDPVTGVTSISTNDNISDKIADVSLDDIFENGIEDLNTQTIKPAIEAISMDTSLEEKDILEIISFMKKVEGKKPVSMYQELPQCMKDIIHNNDEYLNKNQKEFLANELYRLMKNELYTDQQFVELENAIMKETKDIPDLVDMYLDHIRHVMEVDLVEKAETLRKDGNIEKYNTLMDMNRSFMDAYNYYTLKEKILNKKKIIDKELTKELKNYDKHCKKFNAMYKSSKMVITDSRTLLPILNRKLPEDISMDSIKKFIILMLKIFRNKDHNNIVDHTYMYYSTRLIESLDHINSPKTYMYEKIVSNITGVIYLIEGKDEEAFEMFNKEIEDKSVFDNVLTGEELEEAEKEILDMEESIEE